MFVIHNHWTIFIFKSKPLYYVVQIIIFVKSYSMFFYLFYISLTICILWNLKVIYFIFTLIFLVDIILISDICLKLNYKMLLYLLTILEPRYSMNIVIKLQTKYKINKLKYLPLWLYIIRMFLLQSYIKSIIAVNRRFVKYIQTNISSRFNPQTYVPTI